MRSLTPRSLSSLVLASASLAGCMHAKSPLTMTSTVGAPYATADAPAEEAIASEVMVRAEPSEPTNTEGYKYYRPNPWVDTAADKLSTFSIDVDTASYTIARRKLQEGTLPRPESVRVEEYVNYFNYEYELPKTGPFAVHAEAAPSPFDPTRVLFRVGLQAKTIAPSERVPVHLTFLVDVSGSMSSEDKLGLAKQSLEILVNHLRAGDTVAITTYAGATKVVLPPTGVEDKRKILRALRDLDSGGGTGMATGLELAYQQAERSFQEGHVNRVIVLSDGDANLGPTSYEEMLDIIDSYVAKGIMMTTVGFGMGNYQDHLMEQLADHGNGNAVYIDSLAASHRFFGEQLDGTIQAVAKDTKIQVEFSDDAVAKYRLVGYENRDLADDSFRNDKVDAGEVGAGHSVTAIYELQLTPKPQGPLATVRVRAKEPAGTTAKEWSFTVGAEQRKASFSDASSDFQFATAVVGFAEILRGNPDAQTWKLSDVRALAAANTRGKPDRQEFVSLVDLALSF